MNLLGDIIDLIGYLVTKIKGVLLWLFELVGELVSRAYGIFVDLPVSEKLIVVNTITAFFAVILPVARYYIFETYFYINNPLAVYMIGIVLVMWISIFFQGLWRLAVRVALNAYYLFWVIYLPLAGELTRANPHSISIGYYVNIAAPIFYILASLYSFAINRE